MNEITKRILRDLLKKDKAWKWEGKGKNKRPTAPNLAWIRDRYWQEWEYAWVEEIYLPQMLRSYKIFKLIKSGAFGGEYKDLDYVKSHFSKCLIDGQETDTIECDDCLEKLQIRLSGDYYRYPQDLYPQECFNTWWLYQHSEWGVDDTITLDMITELGVMPDHQMALEV